MRLLQLVLIAAILGSLAAIWNAYVSHSRRRAGIGFASIWAILIALGCGLLWRWLCLDLGLLTANLNF